MHAHKLCHKRLEVEDDLCAQTDAVLIKGRPLDDVGLEFVINLGYQLPRESLEDGGGGDAVRQKIVQLCADLQNACGRMFLNDLVGDLCYECLPVWRWD